MARPRKEINQKQFESLCMIQCTEEEIAAVCDVSVDTLERWTKRTYGRCFAEVYAEKRAGGKASLRRNQWKLSETNPTMAIWLGKQYLDQTDKREEKVEIGSDGFLEALHAAGQELNEMSDVIES